MPTPEKIAEALKLAHEMKALVVEHGSPQDMRDYEITRYENAAGALADLVIEIHNDAAKAAATAAPVTQPARVRLVAPNGSPIIGTWETLKATALADTFKVQDDGSLAPEYEGESEMDWDSQAWDDEPVEGERGPDEHMVVAEDGEVWPLSKCIRVPVADDADT